MERLFSGTNAPPDHVERPDPRVTDLDVEATRDLLEKLTGTRPPPRTRRSTLVKLCTTHDVYPVTRPARLSQETMLSRIRRERGDEP